MDRYYYYGKENRILQVKLGSRDLPMLQRLCASLCEDLKDQGCNSFRISGEEECVLAASAFETGTRPDKYDKSGLFYVPKA